MKWEVEMNANLALKSYVCIRNGNIARCVVFFPEMHIHFYNKKNTLYTLALYAVFIRYTMRFSNIEIDFIKFPYNAFL